MSEPKNYTLLVVTENNIGLLNHISIVFTRRKQNILSLTASESKIKGIYTFTIVVKAVKDLVTKIARQIEKIIGVHKVFVYTDEEIVYQEIALYKMSRNFKNNGFNLEKIIREQHARILSIEEDYILIEKTGHKDETEELLRILEPHGLLQFIRSGRVAIAKPMKPLEEHLQELDNQYNY
jgi:acetolactate synthase-1/3 small subunit